MQNNQAIPFNKDNFKQIFSVKFLLVITISVPSAIVADYFNLPLAWFLGPMLVTSVGALMGLKIIDDDSNDLNTNETGEVFLLYQFI